MDGAGNNYRKVLRSRNGVKSPWTIRTARKNLSSKHRAARITTERWTGPVEIVDSNGNTVKLETSGITITAAAKVRLTQAR